MLPAEERLRSAGRLALMIGAVLLALWVLLNAAAHPHHGPVVAPCPPQECVLHPHAPHGPGG